MTSSNVKLPRARVEVAHPYLALMGLFCGGFAGMYSETALNIALPQLSMEVPVIDMRIFSHQGFRVGAVCMMVNFGITLSAMYILPQFYQNGMLLAVAVTGVVMLPGGMRLRAVHRGGCGAAFRDA